ncbi:MAG: TatD family hydrolase, partial [Paraclostridium sp.]
MLFDSHAHLNDEKFDEDRDELINSLKENGVELVLNPGADIETSKASIELAKKYDFIYAAVGVHPHDVGNMTEEDIETLRKLATENEKVMAIGEIGLDYYYDNAPREVQREWFKRQVELANELKLPIIIHDRDAHGDTFEIIKNVKNPEIGCVLHCYSGNVELAKEYVKMGCYISIPGTVTFKNNKKTVEVVREIPLEYLLIETDSPYMAPVPHRGKRNDPSMVQ